MLLRDIAISDMRRVDFIYLHYILSQHKIEYWYFTMLYLFSKLIFVLLLIYSKLSRSMPMEACQKAVWGWGWENHPLMQSAVLTPRSGPATTRPALNGLWAARVRPGPGPQHQTKPGSDRGWASLGRPGTDKTKHQIQSLDLHQK